MRLASRGSGDVLHSIVSQSRDGSAGTIPRSCKSSATDGRSGRILLIAAPRAKESRKTAVMVQLLRASLVPRCQTTAIRLFNRYFERRISPPGSVPRWAEGVSIVLVLIAHVSLQYPFLRRYVEHVGTTAFASSSSFQGFSSQGSCWRAPENWPGSLKDFYIRRTLRIFRPSTCTC